jgi:hypothetical protein
LSAFVVGKFSLDDDAIDVCKIKDVRKVDNLALT